MLFVALLKVKGGTEIERATRRMQWSIPEGITVKAEYLLHTPDPECIFVFEADSFEAMMGITSSWDDVYDIRIYPAIPVQDCLDFVKQAME